MHLAAAVLETAIALEGDSGWLRALLGWVPDAVKLKTNPPADKKILQIYKIADRSCNAEIFKI